MADTQFILVVEDDPILKNLLGHTFAGKYQTLYASDGKEAIALFEQNKPKLVLTDLMMPGVDGFALIEQLRARADEGKTVPIIVVSNLGQDSDKQRALGLGANEYLVKAEMDVDEITQHIERLIGATTIAAAETPMAPSAPVAPAAPAAPTASVPPMQAPQPEVPPAPPAA